MKKKINISKIVNTLRDNYCLLFEYLITLYAMFGRLTKFRRPVPEMLKNKNK